MTSITLKPSGCITRGFYRSVIDVRGTTSRKGSSMATEVVTKYIDDIDGTEADETVKFALDGMLYEIDLNSDHAHKLRAALEPFIEHASNSSKMPTLGRPRKTAINTAEMLAQRSYRTQIRQWAATKGIKVSDRGRIAEEVVVAYEEAMRSAAEKQHDVVEASKDGAGPTSDNGAKKSTRRSTRKTPVGK